VSRKAGWSFRLRLHSGLRQSGAHLSDDKAVAKMGHPVPSGCRLFAGQGFALGTKLGGEFLALEPSVDERLGCAAGLHFGDDRAACHELAAVGDELIEVFVGAGHVWLV